MTALNASEGDPRDSDHDTLWLLFACLAFIAGFTAGAAVWGI